MNLPDKCPFCGAGVRAVKDGNQRWVEFACFTMIGNVVGEFQYRSPICRHAELNATKARVAELEAREAVALARLAAKDARIESSRLKNEAVRRQLGRAEETCDAMEKRVVELEARCKRLGEALSNVELVMQRPASNHRMMQIAEPARRVLNIIKQVKEYKQ